MRIFPVVAAVGFGIIGMTCAFANVLPFPCGWYLEGNYGESHAAGINYDDAEGARGNGAGWSINGGYKFMPNFAAEIGYTDYARTTINDEDSAPIAKAKHYSAEGALKGIWPFSTTGFDVFAKLGVA